MMDFKPSPVLRFQEFKASWKLSKFKNISKKIGSGVTPKGGSNTYVTSGIPFIRSQNVVNNELVLDGTCITIEVHEKMKNSKVKPNDILLNITGASIGRTCVVPSHITTANINQHVCIIRLIDSAPIFIHQFLASSKGQKLIYQSQAGGGREGLNFQNIASFKINLPSLPEQEKIAEFLSTVDKKIQALTKKKELLEFYKKGVMQKIFPAKGRQEPEIRFKPDPSENEGKENGSDYPKWEENRLIEIAKFRRGSFPQPYGLDKWYDDINGFPFIQVFDVDSNFRLKPKTKRRISELATKQSVFIPKGTLIITIQGSIGRVAITHYDSYIDRTLLLFQDFRIKIHRRFLMYSLFLLFEIEKLKAPGGTIKTITKEKLSNFKLRIPTIEEQTKIAHFLSTIDDKISAVDTQIEKMKEWKKGLLQQMFV